MNFECANARIQKMVNDNYRLYGDRYKMKINLINLNLKNKFNLLLVVIFLVGVCISSLALSKILYQQAEQKLTDEGKILMEMIEEIKYYTSVNLLGLYHQEGNPEEFRVSSIPAYAAKTIFNNFKNARDFHGYQYKEATINPTNLNDLPNDFENKLISTFKNDRSLDLLSGILMIRKRSCSARTGT